MTITCALMPRSHPTPPPPPVVSREYEPGPAARRVEPEVREEEEDGGGEGLARLVDDRDVEPACARGDLLACGDLLTIACCTKSLATSNRPARGPTSGEGVWTSC